MKNKAILATCLVTLTLLAGCNKSEEPKGTQGQGAAPSAAPESPATSTPPPSAPSGAPVGEGTEK